MKIKLLSVLALVLAMGFPSFVNAQQESYQKIDELENTIANMQVELDRLRSQMEGRPPQVVLSAPSLDQDPADLRPTLDVAPSYPPGREPPAVLSTTDFATPQLPTIIEEIPSRVIVRFVPVYGWEVPQWIPRETDCGYDCPYNRSARRPPYSSYDYYDPR